MSVTPEYRAFALEQLQRVVPVTARNMFGGVGIYTNGLFFALIDDDTLFLKVDDSNRAMFEAAGCAQFAPMENEKPMQYYALPADVLEDADALAEWVQPAVAVAAQARTKKKRR